jgi:glycosyltransferase involved in cell wall biosynthesis
MPNSEILREMRAHDVLVLPSLFEGFGLVLLEALSQGLPVITTANTGAPEMMQDGVEGFIVPIRDSEAIAERLSCFLADRTLLQEMKHAALRRSAEMSWTSYRRKLAQAVNAHLNT